MHNFRSRSGGPGLALALATRDLWSFVGLFMICACAILVGAPTEESIMDVCPILFKFAAVTLLAFPGGRRFYAKYR